MWFDDAIFEMLSNAQSVANERGIEYNDSWALKNRLHPFFDMVINQFPMSERSAEFVRATQLATLCDTKLSRLSGNYKEDNLIDLCNYIAALAKAWREVSVHENLQEKECPKWMP